MSSARLTHAKSHGHSQMRLTCATTCHCSETKLIRAEKCVFSAQAHLCKDFCVFSDRVTHEMNCGRSQSGLTHEMSCCRSQHLGADSGTSSLGKQWGNTPLVPSTLLPPRQPSNSIGLIKSPPKSRADKSLHPEQCVLQFTDLLVINLLPPKYAAEKKHKLISGDGG